MVEINGLVVRVMDGKVDTDGVAVMEDGVFRSISVCDVKLRHQAIGRLEMLGNKPLKFNAVNQIIL